MWCIWQLEQSKGCIDFMVVIICKALCNMVWLTVLRLLFLSFFPWEWWWCPAVAWALESGDMMKISLISFFALIFRFQPADRKERMGNVPASCHVSCCPAHAGGIIISGWCICLVSASTSADLKMVVGIPPRNFRNYDDLMHADCSHRLNNFLGCMLTLNQTA
jgi:hypothetical protein